jgi:hypothetical protein
MVDDTKDDQASEKAESDTPEKPVMKSHSAPGASPPVSLMAPRSVGDEPGSVMESRESPQGPQPRPVMESREVAHVSEDPAVMESHETAEGATPRPVMEPGERSED